MAEAPLPPVPAGPRARANLLLRPSAPGADGIYPARPDLVGGRVGNPALLLFVIPTEAAGFFPSLASTSVGRALEGSAFFFASTAPFRLTAPSPFFCHPDRSGGIVAGLKHNHGRRVLQVPVLHLGF